MRIGILTDFDWNQRPGGAQRAVGLWSASAPADLELVSCPPGKIDRSCDRYLAFLTKHYSDEELAWLAGQRFLRVEFDYWADDEPQAKWRTPLNQAAQLVLFMSPLQREVYAYRYHATDIYAKSLILPPPMDPEVFTPYRARWDFIGRKDAIFFGEWAWGKGVDIAMKWALHQETMLDMYSPTMPADARIPNRFVRLQGFCPEERWYDVIAGYEQFVHLPRQPECFPYSMLEAYLLGCEVIVAGRLGVESYGKSLDEVIELASESRTKFWDITSSVL